MRDTSVRMEVALIDGAATDARELALFLLATPEVKRRLPSKAESTATASHSSEQAADDLDEPRVGRAHVPIKELWQTLLDAEEEAFFTVSGQCSRCARCAKDFQEPSTVHLADQLMNQHGTLGTDKIEAEVWLWRAPLQDQRTGPLTRAC